ncbi:hypothetical protein M758_9G039700 [Ceratodon purpureus]|nr:hypothetical protein M758_9G039700 [Ceratodon purpureus]KAG0605207.1 hypothetical protein M758_9G039700 [Ceratodon purpureus]
METWKEGLSEAMAGFDWRWVLALVVITYAIYEQLSFMSKRKYLPGPSFVPPFVGNVISMVVDPTGFWEQQANAAKKVGISWNALLGKFVLFVRDSELSQKVFANVRPDAFHLVGHPLGRKLFGEHNLIFMFGEEHKDLRRRLAPLFTLKALGVYISIQEKTQREHIAKWLAMAEALRDPIRVRLLCRDMNLETSQNVFVGPYLTPEMRHAFNEDYNNFNVGLMSLPIYFPGFAFYKATQSVKNLQNTLAKCASASKERMATGAEPACLMDFWMVETVREIREAEAAGLPPPPHSSDFEIGCHLFDFLFAAQDASTSSLVWAIVLTESHPEVLKKLREERARLREGDIMATFTPESLREMKYTEMVVKEVLRYRPPATLVPHIASTDIALTDTYVIPKGTIVFPSLLESSFQGFTDPYDFDPERFSPERKEDLLYKKNWLLFGAGAHQCLGQRYAINQLMLFTSLFSTLVDFKRARTPGCDDLLYTPTIAPKDEGLMYLSARIVA